MAGLFADLYLRQRGWPVEVFERSAAPLQGRGAGITTHPQKRSALANLGIQSELDFGVPVERRLVLDRSGAVIARRTVPQISTSWSIEKLGTHAPTLMDFLQPSHDLWKHASHAGAPTVAPLRVPRSTVLLLGACFTTH